MADFIQPKPKESVIDALIQDEEEAIEGYSKAIAKDQKNEEVYKSIRADEEEHIRKLKNLKR